MTDTQTNPWLQRFDGLNSADEIRSRVTIRGTVLTDLDSTPEYRIGTAIEQALSSFYIPTSADVEILTRIVQRCLSHGYCTYKDRKQYFEKLYIPYEAFELQFVEPICLTGLAGVGKTALIHALQRLLPAPSQISLGAGHSDVPLVSNWHIHVQGRSSINALLKSLITAELGDARKGSVEQLTRLCAKIAHRNGVTLLVIDELQFLTQSANASTLVAQTLSQFSHLGVPVVFAANYSLCRLLQKRSEQERQRLLMRPTVLLPSVPDSPDWANYLLELNRILGSSLKVDMVGQRHAIHRLTAGLKRLVIQLLSIAYQKAWRPDKTEVTSDDINCAYDSIEYSISRNQATTMLASYSAVGSRLYECPFPLPKVTAAAAIAAASHERTHAFMLKVQREALTRQEREHLASTKRPENAPVALQAPSPARKPRRSKLTSAELLQTNLRRKGGGIYPK